MGHTPGPWKTHRTNWRNEPVEHNIYISGDYHENFEEEGDEDDVVVTVVSTSVCIVMGNPTSEPITQANANLIAAAPDYFEAVESIFNSIKSDGDNPLLDSLLDKLYQAHLKAKGFLE